MWIEYTNEKCFENILSMLKYRGWVTENEIKFAREKFEKSSDKNHITNIALSSTIGDYDEVTIIMYLEEDVIDLGKLDSYLRKDENVKKLFVYNPVLYSKKIKVFDKPKDNFYWIEIINMNYLIIDLPTHYLSTKHAIVDKNLDIFSPGSIWDSRLLETIYHSDPQAKYIGAKINDIIKIITEEKIKYRKCIYGYVD